MKVGDILKLVAEPKTSWMKDYTEERFAIIDFPTSTGVEVQSVGSEPEWHWIVSKDNFQIDETFTEEIENGE